MTPAFGSVRTRFHWYLLLITLGGLVLRLWRSGSESITADEASALLRLQFSSFSEMLDQGVRPDGHPAFTQVLLWFWTKWFGTSEWVIRIPFILFGTGAVWFAGLSAKKWFGTGTSLAVAFSLAFLQFPLMYSQLARPYAPGLFFTMFSAWYLSKISTEEKNDWRSYAGFAFGIAGAAYSHYFSLLTVLLLGAGGVFVVPPQRRILFFISCIAGAVLFIPHLSLTLHQLSIGGVGGPGGWLGKPSPSFLTDHLKFIFNESFGLTVAVLFFVTCTIVLHHRRPDRLQILALVLWVVPMITGYLYSVYVNPVLQHSVLLFSFPFLLMFLFSWFPQEEDNIWSYRFPVLLGLPLVIYVTAYKPFRLTDHFGRLREIVATYVDYAEEKGQGKTDAVFNVDADYFINYYLDQTDQQADGVHMLYHNDSKDELKQLNEILRNSDADYFVYGWSTRESSPAAIDYIRDYFPCLVERREWFNSAVYVYSRQPVKCKEEKTVKFRSAFSSDGETAKGGWIGSVLLQKDTVVKSDPRMYFSLNSASPYSPSFRVQAGKIIQHPNDEIVLQAAVRSSDSTADVVFVIEYWRDTTRLHWTGRNTRIMTGSQSKDWVMARYADRPPGDIRTSDQIRVYVYLAGGAQADISRLELFTRKGHEGIFGPRTDFE